MTPSNPTPRAAARTEGRPDYEQIKNLYVSRLRAAISERTFGALHESCTDALRNPSLDAETPYAFAYAARALLHDEGNWLKTPDGTRPSEEMLFRLHTLLDEPRAINCRDNYFYPVVAGVREFVSGNINQSYKFFAQSARFGDYYRVVKDDFGGGGSFCKTFPTPQCIQHIESHSVNELVFWKESTKNLNISYSISFDVLYAKAFAKAWIDIITNLPDQRCGLHFHVIFRHRAQEGILADLATAGAALGDRLTISFEVTEGEFDRAYFASARFIHGADVLSKLNCPIWFVDADAVLKHDTMTFPADTSSYDRVCGLLSFGPNYGYVPWRAFGATWLFAPATEAAVEFLRLVRLCILYLWDDRPGRNWWIDQFALKTAEIYSHRHCPQYTPRSLLSGPHAAFVTSEDYKVATISRVPEISKLLNEGIPYGRAIRDVARSL